MSDMDHSYFQRFQTLIDGLAEKTRAAIDSGQPLWDQVAPDVYELSLTRNSVRVTTRDRDGQRPYILELINENGRSLDSVEDEGPFSSIQLGELYTLVSRGRKDKEVSDAISDVMHELNIPDPEADPF